MPVASLRTVAPTGARRWLVYIRQSKKKTDAAGAVTFASLEIQEEACRRAIAAIDPEAASVALIVDHGRPGGRGRSRPGRDELLRRVEARQADAVMAYKASRIGRDIEESEHLWNRCADAGAFISAADCHDLSNPIVRSVLFGMAQQENLDRSHYSTAIIERRRAQGLPPVKTGVAYAMCWNGDALETVPNEFAVVERVFKLFDSGHSAGEIARLLSAERIPRREAGHSQWDRSAVSRMLRCTWYIGLVPDGSGFWSAGKAFIDRELFERAQARFQLTRKGGQQLTRALSGLLYCAECGGWSPMSLCYSMKPRKDRSVHRADRYRCIHRVRDASFCRGQSIDAVEVERYLLERIRPALLTEDLIEARISLHLQDGRDGDAGEVERHLQQIEHLQKAQRRLFVRRQGGEVIPDFLYNEEMSKLEAECQQHQRAHQLALSQQATAAPNIERLRGEFGKSLAPERWFAQSGARRGDLLRLLFPNGIAVEFGGRPRAPVASRLRPRRAEEVVAADAKKAGTLGGDSV